MKKENPLPAGKSNDEIAVEFVEIILNKRETMQNDVKDRTTPHNLLQDEVRKLEI